MLCFESLKFRWNKKHKKNDKEEDLNKLFKIVLKDLKNIGFSIVQARRQCELNINLDWFEQIVAETFSLKKKFEDIMKSYEFPTVRPRCYLEPSYTQLDEYCFNETMNLPTQESYSKYPIYERVKYEEVKNQDRVHIYNCLSFVQGSHNNDKNNNFSNTNNSIENVNKINSNKTCQNQPNTLIPTTTVTEEIDFEYYLDLNEKEESYQFAQYTKLSPQDIDSAIVSTKNQNGFQMQQQQYFTSEKHIYQNMRDFVFATSAPTSNTTTIQYDYQQNCLSPCKSEEYSAVNHKDYITDLDNIEPTFGLDIPKQTVNTTPQKILRKVEETKKQNSDVKTFSSRKKLSKDEIKLSRKKTKNRVKRHYTHLSICWKRKINY